MIRVCMYNPIGHLVDGHNGEFLTRHRRDNGAYLVDRLVASLTWPDHQEWMQEHRSDLEIIALSDLSFCRAHTSGSLWSGWVDWRDKRPGYDLLGRLRCDPDILMSQVYRDAFGRGWEGFWKDARGRMLAAQPGDIPCDPWKKLPFPGTDPSVHPDTMPYVPPLEAWANVYRSFVDGSQFVRYDGIQLDMTPGALVWSPWMEPNGQGYYSRDRWLESFTAFVRGLTLSGVKVFENAYGAGPSWSGLGTGFELESFGREGIGQKGAHGLWGYLARFDAYEYTLGLPTMTEAQRAQSTLSVQPDDGHSAEEKHRQLIFGLAACHLLDIGYIAWNRTNQCHWTDPHGLWGDEIELWTRLEPVTSTEWRNGWWPKKHRGLPPVSAPEAHAANSWWAQRKLYDPRGEQYYALRLNPNTVRRGDTPPRSARIFEVRR